jgi:hypothetical protein
LLTALIVLLIGGAALYALHRFRGRDVGSSGPATLVASFVPVGAGESEFQVKADLRPGLVGTVADERVDPVDVAATLVDLAIRGHLRIIELTPTGPHAPLDWTFERLDGPDDLLDYEKTLLDAIAPIDGPAALVSKIGAPIEAVVPKAQDQLYTEVVRRGWFSRRPDVVRDRWQVLAWVVLGAAFLGLVALVAFTGFGILGLVLVGLAVVFIALSQEMPKRTASGVSLLNGLRVLSVELANQPLGEIPKARAYEEISQVLPYAVVLGGRERWLQALVDADNDPDVPDPDDLPWYRAEGDWHLADLPGAFDSFLTNVEGRLFGRS